jgi:putative glycerol-1-phosphate prenyltransferase/phosphoglycerol geranylgeranyltransferase
LEIDPMIRLGAIETRLTENLSRQAANFFVLLDPDSLPTDKVIASGIAAAQGGADALLLGGSFIGNPDFQRIAVEIRKETGIPIILFPGGCSHVTPGPDAILFTSLLSGRNPQYLIDEQVKGAVLVKKSGLEAIPTAYLLVESGRTTAVEYISNTRPLPSDKPALAVVHALAAEMMGMRWVYLEAGSGALNPVPPEMVQAVRFGTDLTVLCGGGLRRPEEAAKRVQAGAQGIIVGNFFEKAESLSLFSEFSSAIHGSKPGK